MRMTKKGEIVTGYKITDANMCCRGYQFEIGKWYDQKGKIEHCKNGFHFCPHSSGVWAYYNTGRIFKVEAEYVLKGNTPGADIKYVAKKIRFIEEIDIIGHRNTGSMNTGDRNIGDRNIGHWNTGNMNTGDRNTGHRNTGTMNTGHWNTGHWNTGDRNTGDWNTGDRNTGSMNTGDGNCCNGSSGFFNTVDIFHIFDEICPISRCNLPHNSINRLSRLLSQDESFNYSEFLDIPNATVSKIKQLHEKHIKVRKEIEK